MGWEDFGRLITAMATPFSSEGDLDLDAAERVADWLVRTGSTALVITGSTGESGTLSDRERRDLWRVTAQAVKVPVIAGATTNDTAHSLRLVHDAEEVGARGILAVTPYYNRPPQAGLVSHFSAIAKATRLPVILYDIQVRTGRKIELATIVELVRGHDNVVGVKDASGDIGRAARLVDMLGSDGVVYSGDDSLTLPFLSLGAVGLISVAGHWAGEALARMIRSYVDGDVALAASINRSLLPSYEFESSDLYPNPIPTKAMLSRLGLCLSKTRSPLVDPPDDLLKEADRLLAELKSRTL